MIEELKSGLFLTIHVARDEKKEYLCLFVLSFICIRFKNIYN